jgi:molybdopterin-guanine dinucleotide biosynthesis protein A
VADRSAGIVLAGGRSTRMGSPKAMLEWHGSTLVRRAAGLVARAVDGPVVVVRAAGQDLPPLPNDVEVVDDEREDRGPLQGIAAGLRRIGERADVVFVTGVDTPLLHPAFVAHVLGSLRPDDDVAIPRTAGFQHPLAAAYRCRPLAAALDEQLAADRLQTRALVARLRARELDEADLLADARVAALDPKLESLSNLNTQADYEAARAKPAPRVTIAGAEHERAVDAATLAAAAPAAGVTPIAALIEGHRAVEDPQEPLAAGDRLSFPSPS